MEMPWRRHASAFPRGGRSHTGVVHRRPSRLSSTIRRDFLRRCAHARRYARKMRTSRRPQASRTITTRRAHNHNMVWSPDNQWIYFVHGVVHDEPPDRRNGHLADSALGRIAGATDLPEHLGDVPGNARPGHAGLHRTRGGWVRFVALVPDVGSLERQEVVGIDRVAPRRIPTGIDQYTSVSASRDRGPVVATKANPTASLWRVPIRADGQAEEATSWSFSFRPNGHLRRVTRDAPCRRFCFLVGPRDGRQGVGLQNVDVRDYQRRGRPLIRDAGAGA